MRTRGFFGKGTLLVVVSEGQNVFDSKDSGGAPRRGKERLRPEEKGKRWTEGIRNS